MATGGNFSRTLEGGHEPFYEFSCSLCEDEGRHVEAVKFCAECLVYLCDHCLRDKHNKFPLNKRHQLLNQSQFATVNKSALVLNPTKRCPNHPGELINNFCANHDVVCCSVCKALEHSNCVKTQNLPDAAKGIQTSKEYQSIKSGARTLIFDLEKVLKDRKEGISRIIKEKQHVTQTIADFRKKINKYFDDLEKNSLVELNHREKTIIQGIDKDKKYLETTKSNAEDILKQLESFKGDNECDLFVQVKTGLVFLNDSKNKLRDICKTAEKPSIHFDISKSIEENISSLKMLGSFSGAHLGTTQQPLASAVSRVTSSVPSALPITRMSAGNDIHQLTMKTQYCGKFNVKDKSDSRTCDISSICRLRGDFILIDRINKKLKKLDQSLKLLYSVKLSDEPYSVCAAGPGQVAVSLCRYKKIQFVSVGNKLKLTRSFDVGNNCRGMVYIGNELFVCCGDVTDSTSGCIKVFNNEGQQLRTISRCLSSVPFYITVDNGSQHLLVTKCSNDNITMLDLAGNVVNSFSHNDLIKPYAMCTGSTGQVLVCGWGSNTVVQLSPEHQKIEVILNEADGIKKPQAVYSDDGYSILLVSCFHSNEILAFTLK